MADDIKQVFTLDASQSLDALKQLDSGFAQLQKQLNSNLGSFSAFNSGSGKTVSALIQIKNRADEAFNSLSRLNRIPNPPSVSGGGLPAGPGGSTDLLSGQAAAAAMNQLLGQTASQAANAANAVNGVGNSANNAFNSGRRAANGFALSIETITRVLGTQFLIRSLNGIRDAIEASFGDFLKFSRSVSEIQTISTDPFDTIAQSVRSLSDEFNAPILDVAKAKYEALSNGFVTAADNNAILTASLKFSKVGIATVAQSVDLISTSLNAYGKAASEAETLSAKLFKTIELGRVVGSELANSFGRVAPVAKEVGATEDEILAAFSSITIGGVKASEAATQIRATLTALLKPSDDAKKSLSKLGVETGEQLVKARGFQGALEALIGTTDGSTASIAKLFPNVRALNAVLRETGEDGANIFQSHLKDIQKAAKDLLNQKFELRIDTPAERLEADINRIKNFFTADLGRALVESTANILSWVGGVNTAISALKAFAPVIASVVGSLVAFAAVSTIKRIFDTITAGSAQALTGLNLLKGGLLAFTAAIAAIGVGQFLGEKIKENIEAARKAAEEASKQQLDFQRAQAEARNNLIKIENDQKTRLLHDAVRAARSIYFEEAAAAKEKNEQLIADDKATLDKIIAARSKFASDLKRAAQQAATDSIDSQKRTNDLGGKLDDARFNFQSKRLNDLQKVFANRQRAEELANQGAAKLSSASTPQDKEAADAAFQRAESFAQQAASSAETSGNLTAQIQAEQTIESIIQKRIAAESAFQKNREADAKRLNDQAAIEEKRVTDLKSAAKNFLENANLFDKNGDPLNAKDAAANIEKAKASLAQFKELAFGKGAKFNLEDLFAFDKLQQRLDQTFTKGEVKSLLASGDALDALNAQIQGSVGQARILLSNIALDPAALAALGVKDALNAADEQIDKQSEKVSSLSQASLNRAAAEREIADAVARANALFNEQRGTMEKIARGAAAIQFGITTAKPGGKGLAEFQKELEDLRAQTQKLLTNPNVTSGTVQSLGDKFRAFQANAPSTVGTDLQRASDEFNLLVQILQKRQEIRALDAQGSTDAARQQAQEGLNSASQKAQAEQAAAAAAQANAENTLKTSQAASQIETSFSAAVNTTSQIATNMQRAAEAAVQAAAAAANIAPGGEAQTVALGGKIRRYQSGGFVNYFANGGEAKGTDTIPAMLSPGEFVVNASSTRRFFSQLQAINAGVRPVFREAGGPVGDTFNIGDIIVNGSSDSKQTAREVMSAIRREQRRGTGSL